MIHGESHISNGLPQRVTDKKNDAAIAGWLVDFLLPVFDYPRVISHRVGTWNRIIYILYYIYI